jgi:hypothetical protein
MAQQNIDFGTFPDDPDADAIRTAFSKVQNNFTELFSTVTAGSVTSVNGGAGIAVNAPTGNVIVTANLAQVVVSTSSLSVGQGSNGGTTAVINSSIQTLVIDINPANVFSGNFSGVSGVLANLNGTLTANSNSQPNITSVGTLSNLSVTGNVTSGNVYANSGTIGATLVTGTLTTAAQGNITSVGTLTSLGVNGTATARAFTANTGLFTGDGGGLSNLSVASGSLIISGSSNVKVELNSNVNITAAGNANVFTVTGTGANVNGYLTVSGNIIGSNANLGNAVIANYFIGSGNNLSNIQGANVSGAVSYATTANAVAGANVSGAVSYATTANAVAGANVSGAVSFATTANAVAGANVSGQVSNALVAGTVYTNAQPNITSVGTLTSLTVTGNITGGNVYANSGLIKALYLSGDGSNLTNLSAGVTLVNGNSNVNIPTSNGNINISAVGNANIVVVTGTGINVAGTINATGTITGNLSGNIITASQGNITSLGTLTGLTVNGTTNLGSVSNVKITGSTGFLQSDGAGNLSFSSVITQTIPGAANTVLLSSGSNSINAGANIKFNDPQLDITGTLSVTGNANVGNLGATLVTGTLTTASNNQSNIKLLGTLDYLIINTTGYLSMGSGNITAGNISLIAAGSANLGNSATANYFIGNFYGTANTSTSATNASALLQNSSTSTTVYPTFTTSSANGNSSAVFNTSISANLSNASITATTFVGALSGAATSATSATNASALLQNTSVATTAYPTFTTSSANGNAQAVINTSISSNLANASITATTFVGALSGAATSATTAGTVTTAAQGNITSVGTLTSMTSSGNVQGANVIATSYYIRSVNAAVTAAGTVQGNATALTTEFNRVSTVASGAGVVLPTAVAGMAISIVNSSANSLLVYPATGAAINSLATNAGYSHVTLATLQYIAISSTQWYTVGASYA